MSAPPTQLTLFDSTTHYTLRVTTASQTQEWPLPVAQTLDEAIDAAKGFGLFMMFSQGVFWGPEWDSDTATKFTGFDLTESPVTMQVTSEETFLDKGGNPL